VKLQYKNRIKAIGKIIAWNWISPVPHIQQYDFNGVAIDSFFV